MALDRELKIILNYLGVQVQGSFGFGFIFFGLGV